MSILPVVLVDDESKMSDGVERGWVVKLTVSTNGDEADG
jgi:hypothetical protein